MSLYVNLGDGKLSGPVAIPFPAGIRAVAIDRMDADNLPALVIANDDEMVVLRNTGASFSEIAHLTLSVPVRFNARTSLLLRDLDGDNDADVMLLDSGEPPGKIGPGEAGAIHIFRNLGDGTLMNPVSYASCIASNCSYSEFAAEDLNGDQRPELILVTSQNIFIALNDGSGAFAPMPTAIPQSSNFPTLLVADVDGDADRDLILSSSGFFSAGGQVLVFPNTGTGAFGSPVATMIAAETLFARLADIDRDGRIDLCLPQSGQDAIAVHMGLAGNRFSASQALPSFGTDAMLVDLNTDGLLDTASVNGGFGFDPSSPNPFSVDNTFVSLNLDGGLFGPQVNLRSVRFAHFIHSLDLNGDGLPDLLTADSFNTINNLSPQIQQTNGTFIRPGDSATNTAGRRPIPIDLNTDGRFDAVVASASAFGGPAPTLVHVMRNVDGVLTPPVNLTVGFAPADPIVADFNGDGMPDAAVPSNSFAQATKLALLINDGAGALIPGPTISFGGAGENAGAGAAGDVDGDGDIDLLLAGQKTYLLINDGAGNFTASQLSLAMPGNCAAIGDMDGDALPDLIVGTNVGAAVLLGLGGGLFEISPTIYGIGGWARRFFIANLDQSGGPDIGAFIQGQGLTSTLRR